MVAKTKSKPKTQAKAKSVKSRSAAAGKTQGTVMEKSKKLKPRVITKKEASGSDKVRVVHKISVPNSSADRKLVKNNGLRLPQYNYMRAPGLAHDFQVGDTVEVFCDHEKNRERVRGWIGGIVVQVDNKMVAVQFRSNVFLTDGWMVPDRILWYPLTSEHIRPAPGKNSVKKEKERVIPDY
jgi:hypothetical protein